MAGTPHSQRRPNQQSGLTLAAVFVVVALGVIWVLRTGRSAEVTVPLLAVHEFGGPILSLDFHPAHPRQILVSAEGGGSLLDVVRGPTLADLAGEPVELEAGVVRYSPTGMLIASAWGGKGSWQEVGLRLRDASSGTVVWALETPPIGHHVLRYTSLSFSPDGQLVAAASHQEPRTGFHVWDLGQRKLLHEVQTDLAPIEAVAFSPDGLTLAVATRFDGGVHLWDTTTWEHIGCAYAFGEGITVRSLSFSSEGQYVAAGSEHGNILLWDRSSGQQHILAGHDGEITALALSPDEAYLVSGSADGTLRIWDTRTASVAQVLLSHNGSITSVAFSRDGTFLAAGTELGRVLVYAFSDRYLTPLAPSVLASQTFVDIDGDGVLEVIEIYLAEGHFYHDTAGWCGNGLKRQGVFHIRVRRGNDILSEQSIREILGRDWRFLWARGFELVTRDYNGDGQLDFNLAEYGGCSGSWVYLLTIDPEGRIAPLVSQGFYVAAFAHSVVNPICLRPGLVGFTFYDMGSGRYRTRWYRWQGSDLVFAEDTTAFCWPGLGPWGE